MTGRYMIAAAILATTSSAALACPDCDADYMAFMEAQAAFAGEQADAAGDSSSDNASAVQLAQEDAAKQEAFRVYEADKMAKAKTAFLSRFKDQGGKSASGSN